MASLRLETIKRNVELDIRECPECGTIFGVMQTIIDRCYKEGGFWSCPNGHQRGYREPQGQSEEEKLRAELVKSAKRLEMAETETRRARDSRDAAYRSQSAMRGVLTRTKNRIAKGVCPCCNRTFVDMHRHMMTKHPDYETATEETI